MAITALDHDEYLLKVADPLKRAALTTLRQQLKALLPDAEECISYGLPTFRAKRGIVAYGVAAKHCSLYPMSADVIALHIDDLADFDISKGTIRFTPEHPLPAALLEKIVAARLAEMR